MGIVNVTPDSFSDGGAYSDTSRALAHCERLLREGADLLDLGAESTRPGSRPVPLDEELSRLLPVLRAALTLGCPVSVDTSKAGVMQRALDEGADIINDIHALQLPGSFGVIRAHPNCGVCLMHMQGMPEYMQQQPAYTDVVVEVHRFLSDRGRLLTEAGVAADRLVFDPGIGFGKSVEHNLQLLRRQDELLSLGRPLLVGWSRKSTLRALAGAGTASGPSGRSETEPPTPHFLEIASVAAALAAVQRGARILRVHDVAATAAGLKIWQAAGLTA